MTRLLTDEFGVDCCCPTVIAQGACCVPLMPCSQSSAQECADAGGVYQGDNEPCSPDPCPDDQACCFPDGFCAFVPVVDCTNALGTPQGPGTVCTPNPCPQQEACCFPDGFCAFILEQACFDAIGTPQGPGSVCTPNPCPMPMGACCDVPQTACFIDTADNCLAAGGNYQGDKTTCVPDPCVPGKEACCFSITGDCFMLTPGFCASADGDPQGPGTVCEPNPCAVNQQCCNPDSSCDNITVLECTQQGGTPQGPGTDCSGPPCPLTICPAPQSCFSPCPSSFVITMTNLSTACAGCNGIIGGPCTFVIPMIQPQPVGECTWLWDPDEPLPFCSVVSGDIACPQASLGFMAPPVPFTVSIACAEFPPGSNEFVWEISASISTVCSTLALNGIFEIEARWHMPISQCPPLGAWALSSFDCLSDGLPASCQVEVDLTLA